MLNIILNLRILTITIIYNKFALNNFHKIMYLKSRDIFQ